MKNIILSLLLLPVFCFSQESVTITFSPNVSGTGANGTAPDTSKVFVVANSDDFYLSNILLSQGFADTLTFLVSADGSNWFKLTNPATTSAIDYVVEADSSKASSKPLDRDVFLPLSRFKLISDVGVGSDSTLTGILGLRSRRSFF